MTKDKNGQLVTYRPSSVLQHPVPKNEGKREAQLEIDPRFWAIYFVYTRNDF